jgi:hypothetical protein
MSEYLIYDGIKWRKDKKGYWKHTFLNMLGNL